MSERGRRLPSTPFGWFALVGGAVAALAMLAGLVLILLAFFFVG